MELTKWLIGFGMSLTIALTAFLTFKKLEQKNLNKGVRVALTALLVVQVFLLGIFPHGLLFCGLFFLIDYLLKRKKSS